MEHSDVKTVYVQVDRETHVEMIKLYWDEMKYRHDNYWKLFTRFSYALIFLLAIPHVYPEKIRSVGRYVVLFPIVGIVLSMVAGFVLAAEYRRISAAGEKMNELKPERYKPKEFGGALRLKIGWVVTATFVIFFAFLSILNLTLLLNPPPAPAPVTYVPWGGSVHGP
ncbi:MAG TPA: hypothetical protein VIV57_25355 [Anaeromyxobacter sp.]